jgi:dTDP-4-amino-4,6-dideoxygalactose transaminase
VIDKIRIPFNRPFIAGKELFYIAQAVMDNSHTAGDGPFTKKCQTWLEERLGCRKVFLTHSCTAALEISAILADIQPGDEIIMPSYTFVSTANSFVLRGGVPVFIDIRPDTLNIDENLIETAITSRTRAILPVHYAGISCNMDIIMDIAGRHNLFVIEDAAQGIMSSYKGRQLGTIGHFGAFSFHETKNIISGEGGALLVNDEKFVERAEIVREKGTNRSKFFRGQVDKYTWVDVGSSYLPSDIIAAFLYAQMENADQIIAKRNLIYAMYLKGLRPLAEKGYIQLPATLNDCCSNNHMFYIITRSLKERKELARFLRGKGILAVFHYVPLHSSPAGKLYGRISGKLEITERVSESLLRLPLYHEMTNEDIDSVIENIKSFYKT